MFTLSESLDAKRAANYFKEEYSLGDYMMENEDTVGYWLGGTANKLGLPEKTPVTREDFENLLKGNDLKGNLLIQEGTSQTRTKNKHFHRAAYGGQFSPPKSVSIEALVFGNEEIVKAHHRAVKKASLALEKFADVKAGTREDRYRENTRNLAMAVFTHDASRNLDPALHSHVVVINTSLREDGQFRAIEPLELYRAQKYTDNVYLQDLSKSLVEIGYILVFDNEGSFEIKGYDRETIMEFSTRHKEILEFIETEDLADGVKNQQIAWERTRKAKVKIESEPLREWWNKRAEKLNITPALRVEKNVSPEKIITPKEAINYAKKHFAEREAVFNSRDIISKALAYSFGQDISIEDLEEEVKKEKKAGRLLSLEKRYNKEEVFTTKENLELEKANIAEVKKGERKQIIKKVENMPDILTEEQQAVLNHILTSEEKYIAVEGLAGTGKTFTLSQVKNKLDELNVSAVGGAVTTKAADKVQESNIEAKTITKLLKDDLSKKDILFIDEASMLSTQQCNDIFQKTKDKDIKVVFIGDKRQYPAVPAGMPFKYLQEKADINIVEMKDIYRQQTPELKEIVQNMAIGKMDVALDKMEEYGKTENGNKFLKEIPQNTKRYDAIANEYLKDSENTLVVSPVNKERKEINENIREKLKSLHEIDKYDHKINVLEKRDLTAAEKTNINNYNIGDFLQFSKGSKVYGIEPFKDYEVLHIDQDTKELSIASIETGEVLSYNPKRVKGCDVFMLAEKHISEGDKLVYTYAKDDIATNTLVTVKNIDKKNNILTLGRENQQNINLDLDEKHHLDYGYCLTAYKSQGETVNKVIVSATTGDKQAKKAINETFGYVSSSRAKHDIQIYTDNVDELKQAFKKEQQKINAVEY